MFWILSIKICILPCISLLPFVYLLAQLRPAEILPSYFSFSLIDFSEISWRHSGFSLDGVLLWASLSILAYLQFWNNFHESCLYCFWQRYRLLFVHQYPRREIRILCRQGWLASCNHNIIYLKSEIWNMYPKILWYPRLSIKITTYPLLFVFVGAGCALSLFSCLIWLWPLLFWLDLMPNTWSWLVICGKWFGVA